MCPHQGHGQVARALSAACPPSRVQCAGLSGQSYGFLSHGSASPASHPISCLPPSQCLARCRNLLGTCWLDEWMDTLISAFNLHLPPGGNGTSFCLPGVSFRCGQQQRPTSLDRASSPGVCGPLKPRKTVCGGLMCILFFSEDQVYSFGPVLKYVQLLPEVNKHKGPRA